MKAFFENRPERKFVLLLVAVGLMAALLIHESRRHLLLQKQLSATVVTIDLAKEKEATLLEQRATAAEKRELLAQYEKRIPSADSGYVLVSRVVRGAVPDVAVKISPPVFDGQQLPLSPEYCCGAFDVRGSGRLDELLQILQKVESDLPFARIQNLHFSFAENQVNFSFSLQAVMRLNQDFES